MEQQTLVDQWRLRQLQRLQAVAAAGEGGPGGSAARADGTSTSIDSSTTNSPRAWFGADSTGSEVSGVGRAGPSPRFALTKLTAGSNSSPDSSDSERLLGLDTSGPTRVSVPHLGFDFGPHSSRSSGGGSDGGWSDTPGSPSRAGSSSDPRRLKMLCYHLFQQLVAATAATPPGGRPSGGGGSRAGSQSRRTPRHAAVEPVEVEMRSAVEAMMLAEGIIKQEWLDKPRQFRTQFASAFRGLRSRHSDDPLVMQLFESQLAATISTSSSFSASGGGGAAASRARPPLPPGRQLAVNPQQAPAASRYATDFEEVTVDFEPVMQPHARDARIGKGGFGSVFRAKNKIDGRTYAVKKVVGGAAAGSGHLIDRVLREVKTLSGLAHPYVVRYYQSWIEQAELMAGEDEDEDDTWGTSWSSAFDGDDDDYEESDSLEGHGRALPARPRLVNILFIQMDLCQKVSQRRSSFSTVLNLFQVFCA